MDIFSIDHFVLQALFIADRRKFALCLVVRNVSPTEIHATCPQLCTHFNVLYNQYSTSLNTELYIILHVLKTSNFLHQVAVVLNKIDWPSGCEFVNSAITDWSVYEK